MNYSAGSLELNLIGYSNSAVASIRETTEALNKLSNAIKKISQTNFGFAGQKLEYIFSKIAKSTNSINTENIQKLASSAKSLSAISKIGNLEKVDFDKVGKGFTKLTVAITPFIEKVQSAEASLTALYGVLSKTSGKKIQGLLDNKKSQNGKGFSFFNIARWTMAIYMGRRLGRTVAQIAKSGMDYTETLNLWETSMGSNLTLATEFVNKMNEAYGISEKTLMNAQAIFKNMLGSLGQISDTMAYQLSEGITQMALDYASLYNVTFEQAFTKFQAALAGQVRPIRSVAGYDITETTLFQLYQSLGGTKTMRQLTRTEKQLLSIYAIFQQMDNSGAVGDLSKTMTSLANQSRVLAEGLGEIKTWLGVIISYTIQESGIMTKINALVITAYRYLEAIAKSIGAIQSFGGADPFAGTEQSAEGAIDALDELKGKLLDFDKFRSLSGTEESALGLDKNLLEALSGYNSILEKSQLEARKLSDEWFRTLGFTIDANGELVLTNEHIQKAKSKIQGIVDFLGSPDGLKILSEITLILKSVGTILLEFLPIISKVARTTSPIFMDLLEIIGVIVEILDELDMLQSVIVLLISLKISTKIQSLATSLKSLSVAGQSVTMFVMSAMTSFMLLDGLLSGLEGSTKRTVGWIVAITSALATMLGVILAIKGGVQGGLIGATIAGLGVGGLLAGIKAITSVENFANGGMPDKGTLFRAGEAGAEIVYNTPSGQSGVANVQQIAQATYSGTIQALNDWWGGRNAKGDIPQLKEASATGMYQAVTGVAKSYGNTWKKI